MEFTAATGSVNIPLALATVTMFFKGLHVPDVQLLSNRGITTTLFAANAVSGTNTNNAPIKTTIPFIIRTEIFMACLLYETPFLG